MTLFCEGEDPAFFLVLPVCALAGIVLKILWLIPAVLLLQLATDNFWYCLPRNSLAYCFGSHKAIQAPLC